MIPKIIWQTWKTRDPGPATKRRIQELKAAHPDYQHYLFDDNDCYQFILRNFGKVVATAYLRLVPGAYKADLWRYCVIYVHGGVYMDARLKCINGFNLNEVIGQTTLVRDNIGPLSIFNSFMVCEKGYPLLLIAIKEIVKNVATKFYGENPLDPTGPCLLGRLVLRHKMNAPITLKHASAGKYIERMDGTQIIGTEFPEYFSERAQTNSKTYSEWWHEKGIYK